MTMMVFVSMSGIRSIGSLTNEKIPKMMTAAKQRLVIIGRLTALSYIAILFLLFLFVCRRGHHYEFMKAGLFHNLYFLSVSKTCLACNDNLVAIVYARENLVCLAYVLAELNLVV